MQSKAEMLKLARLMLILVLVPLGLGLLAFGLARMFLQPIPSFFYSADLGMAGIVFGATVRDPSIVVFVCVTTVAFIFLSIYLVGRQQKENVRQMISDTLREAEQGRRRFLAL